MELISSLPDDLARECLVRVPYSQFPTVAAASKRWREEIRSPEFSRHRRDASRRQKLLIFSQSRSDPNQKSRRFGMLKRMAAKPIYRLTLLELETARWFELPPPPGFSDGLPLFCQLVVVGSDLVFVGGVDGVTGEVSNSVFVYSFLDATWRRGADMPGVRRSFFGCGSDYLRMVFVAGGHDGDKNALSSALVYDVAEDKWMELPDMSRRRDECKGIFLHGKYQVISGYDTENQGWFSESAEAFDVSTWKWSHVDEDFLDGPTLTCPQTCIAGVDTKLYMCHENGVVAWRDGSTCKPVAELPSDMCSVSQAIAW